MRSTIAWALLCLLACTSVHAADDRDACPPDKFMQTSNYHFTRNQWLAFLNTIDRSNFSEAKQKMSASGVLPFDVPVEAQGSYSDFQKWWSVYKSQTHYSRTDMQDLSIVTSMFDPAGLKAYQSCLANGFGLSSFLTLNGNQATVTIHWKPFPPLTNQPVPPSVGLVLKAYYGNKAPQISKQEIMWNGDVPAVYSLTPGVPFTLTVEIPHSTSTSVSALIPKDHQCWLPTPTVTMYHPENPVLVDAHERTNKYLTANEKNILAQWKASLEKEGKQNVITWVAYEFENDSQNGLVGSVTGQKWRSYYGILVASYGGGLIYGSDPRCEADESPTAPPSK